MMKTQNLSKKPTINVINIFDLMELGHFTRHQKCKCLKKPDPDSIVLMVSHRWNTPKHPDPGPNNMQFHGVIRFVIQACMIAMGSTPNVFNSVDFSEIMLCPELLMKLRSLHQKYSAETRKGNELLLHLDPSLSEHIRILFEYLNTTIGEENTLLVINDIPVFAYMMNNIDIWYDFISLPQRPRTDKEEFYFGGELSHLEEYFSKYFTVILWSKESIHRAWCFLEAAISMNSSKHSIFSCENSLLSSDKPAPIEQLYFDMSSITLLSGNKEEAPMVIKLLSPEEEARREDIEKTVLERYGREKSKVDLSHDLTIYLTQVLTDANFALRKKNEFEIRSYLESNGFQCTNGADIKLIAQKLAIHYGGPNRKFNS